MRDLKILLDYLTEHPYLALASTEDGGWELLDLIGLQQRDRTLSYYDSSWIGYDLEELMDFVET